ncbi:hypothetical protein [Streptomyces palmae]|uniref:Lipoprotein n=1 Tax=Streptomyces palmae TaxID=1701085 RepID=A0A4Z0G8M4_9ACTN|nr:hypothetical protein [Streptomyces palmae]TGA92610.1 hypothetical protein E4099_27440 [Streptomyces palmae]
MESGQKYRDLRAAFLLMGAALLCATTSACGTPDKKEEFTTASKVCGGAFTYAPEALEELRSTREFLNEDSDFLDAGTKEIIGINKKGSAGYGKSGRCHIARNTSDRDSAPGSTDISVDYYEARDLGRPEWITGKPVHYRLGELAIAGPQDAELYFECIGPSMDEPSKPARVLVSLRHSRDYRSRHPATLRETNMKVVYSASLALARKLECKNDGGLPDRLVLQEVG